MERPLPECLDSEEKQQRMAEDLTSRHCKLVAISSSFIKMQGSASITLEVALEGDTNVIIQFREQPFDPTPNIIARQLLGDAVPTTEILQSDDLSAADILCLLMSKMPGIPWFEVEASWTADDLLRAATSLGQLLSGCFMPTDDEAIETAIVPQLKKILAHQTCSGIDLSSYFPLVERLIAVSGRLKGLPGFFTHEDLNPTNVFTDQLGNTRGILDWEQSRVLPFGLGGRAIHFLAGMFVTLENDDIGFVERSNYESMERAFWSSLLQHPPEDAIKTLHGRMESVQIGIIIGTVLHVLGIPVSAGREYLDLHLPSVEALPKLLSYRAPFIRGAEEKPFTSDNDLNALISRL